MVGEMERERGVGAPLIPFDGAQDRPRLHADTARPRASGLGMTVGAEKKARAERAARPARVAQRGGY